MIDPACGTGGFLIAMFLYIVENFREMTREQRIISATRLCMASTSCSR
jgi:type I restriction-modification system DNA methylase subunit